MTPTEPTDEQVIAEAMGWTWTPQYECWVRLPTSGGYIAIKEPMRDVERKLAEMGMADAYWLKFNEDPNEYFAADEPKRIRLAAAVLRERKCSSVAS